MRRTDDLDRAARPLATPLLAALLLVGCGASQRTSSDTDRTAPAMPVAAATTPAQPAPPSAADAAGASGAVPAAAGPATSPATTAPAGALDVTYYYLPG